MLNIYFLSPIISIIIILLSIDFSNSFQPFLPLHPLNRLLRLNTFRISSFPHNLIVIPITLVSCHKSIMKCRICILRYNYFKTMLKSTLDRCINTIIRLQSNNSHCTDILFLQVLQQARPL